jgi:hypothetical protein
MRPLREKDGQRKAMRWRHPCVHGGGVQSSIIDHRPQGTLKKISQLQSRDFPNQLTTNSLLSGAQDETDLTH